MNQNKFMALLLGEHCHIPYVSPTGQTSRYRCGDPTCMFHKHQSLDPLWRDNPAYHDSKGRMTLETIDKVIKKMPGVWEKYLKYTWDQQITKFNVYVDKILSLSNFLNYLRDNKEWAYVECNVDCFGNDDFYKPDDCMGCDGKNRQILNPAYAEALRELENE